jgi:hypothetical protein
MTTITLTSSHSLMSSDGYLQVVTGFSRLLTIIHSTYLLEFTTKYQRKNSIITFVK